MAVTKLRRSRRIAQKERMSIKDTRISNEEAQSVELGEYRSVKGVDSDDHLGSIEEEEDVQGVWELDYHDRISMVTLLVLYCLQGIPMGLSASIPLLLKEHGTSYAGLSLFSLVSLPFSCKLLWAPIVDSCYAKSMGRRKTWLIPIQLMTGVVMILSSPYIEGWLYGRGEEGPHVEYLTVFFLSLYFFMATQDIAVDGWALTMLSRRNVGYASTCNTIGQLLGYFISNQGFIALSDSLWCKRFLGMDGTTGLVTLHSFMAFFGWVFLIVTGLVWLFKGEKDLPPSEEPESVLQTYQQVIGLSRLSTVRGLVLVLMTVKFAFAPADSVATFKLQDRGMPKADIATYSPIPLVIGLFLPALIGRVVANDPISIVQVGIPLKLFTCFLSFLVVQATTDAYANGSQEQPYLFIIGYIATLILHEVAGTLIFMSFMSFFNKVSDPSIGGTYMTLLNTVSNLGYKWPSSLAIALCPKLTTDSFDGYTVETLIGSIAGIAWLLTMSGLLKRLRSAPPSEWMYTDKSTGSMKEK